MRSDVFVYLSGPITAKHGRLVEENTAVALRAYWDCLKAGIPAFCPHLSAGFPSAFTEVPYEAWLAYDFAVIDRCTDVVLLPNWQQSEGAIKETEYAKRIGKPIHLSLDLFFGSLAELVEGEARFV